MSRMPARLIPALLLCLSWSHTVSAGDGIVAAKKSGCDYFVLKTADGHGVAEWNGHHEPTPGDVLRGEFVTGTMKLLQNVTAGAETKVWIEDYPLSENDAMAAYSNACD